MGADFYMNPPDKREREQLEAASRKLASKVDECWKTHLFPFECANELRPFIDKYRSAKKAYDNVR